MSKVAAFSTNSALSGLLLNMEITHLKYTSYVALQIGWLT